MTRPAHPQPREGHRFGNDPHTPTGMLNAGERYWGAVGARP